MLFPAFKRPFSKPVPDRRIAGCLVVGLAACTVFADAPLPAQTTVRGQVQLTRPIRENPSIGSQSIIRLYSLALSSYDEEAAKSPSSGSSRVVVFFERLNPSNSGPAATDHNKSPGYVIIDQKNEQFIPHILAIQTGTEVRFLNSDSIYHNVFSLSPAKTFDLGKYPRGTYRSVVFDKPGIVKVYCDIHTHMSAYVIVLKTPFFDTTDEQGNFEIKNLPPGRYALKLWSGNWPIKSQNVTIKSGETVYLQLKYP